MSPSKIGKEERRGIHLRKCISSKHVHSEGIQEQRPETQEKSPWLEKCGSKEQTQEQDITSGIAG